MIGTQRGNGWGTREVFSIPIAPLSPSRAYLHTSPAQQQHHQQQQRRKESVLPCVYVPPFVRLSLPSHIVIVLCSPQQSSFLRSLQLSVDQQKGKHAKANLIRYTIRKHFFTVTWLAITSYSPYRKYFDHSDCFCFSVSCYCYYDSPALPALLTGHRHFCSSCSANVNTCTHTIKRFSPLVVAGFVPLFDFYLFFPFDSQAIFI